MVHDTDKHTWSARFVASRQHTTGTRQFAVHLTERFTKDYPARGWVAEMIDRFSHDTAELDQHELTLAPFAPPLRQISTARQGAAEWSSRAWDHDPTFLHTPPSLDHTVEWLPQDSMNPLLGDLMSSGWIRQAVNRLQED